MKRKNRSFIFEVTLFLLLAFSCSNSSEVKSVGELKAYISNPDNGLIRTRYLNGISVTVQYIPAAMILAQDIRSGFIKSDQADSILNEYAVSHHFRITIGPDDRKENKSGDVMFHKIKNYKDYKERVYLMNFELENYITLEAGEWKGKPALLNLENVYGLTKERDINVVFSPKVKKNELMQSDTLRLEFEDPLFDMGTLNFVFLKEDIIRIPELTIKK
jgi:hypothetical protein